MTLSLQLDQSCSFEISFYETEKKEDILCLILTEAGQHMLLQRAADSGQWQEIAGGSFHRAFEQAILESVQNLIPCMLAIRSVQKDSELDPRFRR
jgi:hypothetical protein